jgi:hypothetical protein
MSSTFRVGDRVRFPFGSGRITGVITEDRGAIGYRGRHLYEVSVPMDPFEPTILELAGDEIEAVDEREELAPAFGADQIEAYLANGGLIAILRSNSSGGRKQPRAGLRPDSVGNVTHTFDQERGVVGGRVVPFAATHGDKVFTPKRDEVLSFLRSFHLDRRQAERVLSAVGTAP